MEQKELSSTDNGHISSFRNEFINKTDQSTLTSQIKDFESDMNLRNKNLSNYPIKPSSEFHTTNHIMKAA